MLLLRCSVLAISVGWLFLLPLYAASDYWGWATLATAAWGAAGWSSSKALRRSGQLPHRSGILHALLAGGLVALAIGLLQGGLIPFYYRFGSVYHSAWPVAPALCEVLKLFGFTAAWQVDLILVQTFREVIRFSVTLEKLAFLPLCLFLVGEGLCLFMFRVERPWKVFATTVACLVAYASMRMLILTAVYLHAQDVSLFWRPGYILLSLAPLPLLLERFNPAPISDPMPSLAASLHWKPTLQVGVFMVLAIAGLIGYLGFQDPGLRKQGRVLIDDAHGDWELTTRKFDKEWFGKQSLYNYYLARNFTDYYFQVDVNVDRPITAELLDDYDVMVAKTPTTLYSEAEKGAIQGFVQGGGGLFLIGDHTNLFGMSTVLNDLARAFRIQFNFDDTFDLMRNSSSSYTAPSYLSHPVVRGLRSFEFETSCTLDVPLSAEFIMVGSGLGREWVDYSHKNFFGNIKLDPDEDFGLFVQAAAVKSGQGRVLAFSDSTVFSNFSFFWPGKAEFFLSALDYLNRQNRYAERVNEVLLAFGAVSAIAAVRFIYRFDMRGMIPFFALLGAVVSWIFSAGLTYWNGLHYPKLEPHTKYRTVAFESQYSGIGLTEVSALLEEQVPEEHLLHGLQQDHQHRSRYRELETFRTFYINLARVGVFPTVKGSLQQALDAGDFVVVINPKRPFHEDDQIRVDGFLHRGGRLLLMDSITNNTLIANQFLRRFNARINFSPLPIEVSLQIPEPGKLLRRTRQDEASSNFDEPVKFQPRPYGALTIPRLEVIGEHWPIFGDEGGRVLAVEIPRGKGALVVFVDSSHFSNAVMGRVYKQPTEQEIRVYQDMFYLFESHILKETSHSAASTGSSAR